MAACSATRELAVASPESSNGCRLHLPPSAEICRGRCQRPNHAIKETPWEANSFPYREAVQTRPFEIRNFFPHLRPAEIVGRPLRLPFPFPPSSPSDESAAAESHRTKSPRRPFSAFRFPLFCRRIGRIRAAAATIQAAIAAIQPHECRTVIIP